VRLTRLELCVRAVQPLEPRALVDQLRANAAVCGAQHAELGDEGLRLELLMLRPRREQLQRRRRHRRRRARRPAVRAL
jgi:hypothetical protein